MYVNVYIHLLKESKIPGALERVQKSFSAAEHPWLFVACAASVLAKEKEFFLIEADVSPFSRISLTSEFPILFWTGQKQLFITNFTFLNISKDFGIPKMKVDFQNIDWEIKSFEHYLLTAWSTIGQ